MKKIQIDARNPDYALIKEAAQVLSDGGIVALPTETVYGLGGRADNKAAVDKLYTIKKRPADKPFSFALGRLEDAVRDYFDVFPPFGYRLIERFWPGPLTIIYYAPKDEKIGVRIPAHPVTNEILRALNKAVYLPSANISGEKEAVSAAQVEKTLGGKIDLIVDGGKCDFGRPSTVVDLTEKPFKTLREGVIPEGEIAKIFIKKRILFVCTGNSCRSPLAQFLLGKSLYETKAYAEERFEVVSAGVSAFSGAKVTPPVLNILKQKEGIDAEEFKSQRLDKYMILSSDLIFTMEDRQSEYILRFEPKAESRVFNLKKFLPTEFIQDIPDPIGKSEAFYEEVYSLIKQAVLELSDWL